MNDAGTLMTYTTFVDVLEIGNQRFGAALVGGVIISLLGAAFIVWRGPHRSDDTAADIDENMPASFADASNSVPTAGPAPAIEGAAA